MFLNQRKAWMASALAVAIALAGCDNGGSNNGNNNGNNDNDTLPDPMPEIGWKSFDQRPVEDDVFYFVMPDRFYDGDPSNNYGGLGGDRYTHGFDPTDRAFYHGGDLVGLIDQLDYIEGMGVTAIWLTPILKNKAVQGSPGNASAAYHGYWTLDFTQVDPHLGTNEDLHELIEAAHERDIKVFFDIITNHTADVIKYEECHDADGNHLGSMPVDGSGAHYCPYKSLEDLADGDTYTPFVPAGEENSKYPEWLNDPQYYHNQGDSTWSGENAIYGDFVGLDDLATSDPFVIDGMIDIFKDLITEFRPDGFRIDTVKHVHTEFWQAFSPAIIDHAKAEGIDNFFMFGEVYSGDPEYLSFFTTEAKLQSVLDFAFQGTVQSTVAGGGTPESLRNLFLADDLYADHDSDASTLMNFIGNHDMGRIGYFLGGQDTAANLKKAKLAHSMMYFLRGVPVIYYGDEQGFTGSGDGSDQWSRQNMFPAQVAEYQTEVQIGTSATPADDNFDTEHPIYLALAEYAQVLREHPTLRQGVQHERYAQSGTKGAYVVSRVHPELQIEYLVAFNTSNIPTTVSIPAASNGYTAVYGAEGDALITDGDVELSIPGFGTVIYKADEPLASSPKPVIELTGIQADATYTGTLEIGVDIDGLAGLALPGYSARFEYSIDDGANWTLIADDHNAPYRAYFRLGAFDDGTDIKVQATVTNAEGEMAIANTQFSVDSRYPETVNVTYANPNSRDALFVISDGGQFRGPITADGMQFSFGWGEDDNTNLLIWATLDRVTGEAQMDQPYRISRTDLFAASEEDGEGGLVANLSVDSQMAVDLTLTGDDLIVEAGKAIDATIDGLNLRGGIVGWGAESAVPMINTERSTYHGQALVVRGDGEFKFADNAWAAINLGGPITEAGLTLGNNPSNLMNFFEASSVYDFWIVGVDVDGDGNLDRRLPLIEINHGELGRLVYLRGDMNDWETSNQLVHQGNSLYSLTLRNLEPATYEFKIADSEYEDVNLGFSNVTIDPASAPLTNTSGNITLEVTETNDYSFTLDASNPADPVLLVEGGEVPPYGAGVVPFVAGDVHSDTELTFVGNSRYEGLVLADPHQDGNWGNPGFMDFKVVADGTYYGGTFSALDTEIALADGGSPNLSIELNGMALYRMTLDATEPNSPTLTISQVDAVVVHYYRADGDYTTDAWGIHVWGAGIDPEYITEWDDYRTFEFEDDFGALIYVPILDDTEPFNFIVKSQSEQSGNLEDNILDDGADVVTELWYNQGGTEVYTTREAAEAAQ